MRTRSARQIVMVVVAPLLGIVIGLSALGGVASAHVVTSISADCYQVTVQFNDFPDSGVPVHIAADVNGRVISTDVLVTSATTTAAQLDISAATATLADTPADIVIDVTWTYLGPQHAHKALTLTCGTSTTTSSSSTTTTQAPATTAALPATTTSTAITTTTAGQQVTTTTQVRGTTVVATTAPTPTTTATIRRLGTTVAATTTTAPAVGTLPRTGSTPTFPLVFGLSSLISGALILLRQRHAWSR